MKAKVTINPSTRTKLRLSLKFKLVYFASALLFAGVMILIVINTSNPKHSRAETTGMDFTFTGATSTAWNTSTNWDLGTVPTASDNVIIPAGKECACGNSSRQCMNLIVDGILSIPNGSKSLTIGGTLAGAGSILGNGVLNLNGGGSFSGTITNGGTLAITGPFTMNGLMDISGSVTVSGGLTFGSSGIYRHKQNGGSIPTATWDENSTCLLTGVTNTLPTGLDQAFGNFTWACTMQSGDIGNIGPLTITGTLSIQGTGSSDFKFAPGTSSAANYTQTLGSVILAPDPDERTLNINGYFSMTGGTLDMSKPSGEAVDGGNSTLNIATNFTLAGGIIQNTYGGICEIDIDGDFLLTGVTLDLTGGTALYVAGDWTQNGGTFTQATGIVTFDGAASQLIGGGSTLAFNDVVINNSADTQKVVLSKLVTINGVMTFTDGILDAQSYYSSSPILIFSTSGTVADTPCDSSHAIGPTRKITNSTNIFTFPIGNTPYYRPISITPSNTNSTTWTANYFWALPPNNTVLYEWTGVHHVSNKEYWTLDRATGGTPADGKIRLSWNENSGVSDTSDICVAHNTGIAWEGCSGDDWTYTSSGDTLDGWVETKINWSSYSPFTLGSKSGKNTTLPVELISFDAKCANTSVILNWKTASETNNDYFSVERSPDGFTYTSIGITDGAGNSNSTVAYQFTDTDPYSGANYYRLKQVDFDGAYEYSTVIAVNMSLRESAAGTITAGPNPFTDNINVNYMSSFAGLVEVMLYDMSGKSVKTMQVEAGTGLNTFSLSDISNLPAGIYMLGVISSNNKMTALVKMIKDN